MDKKDLLENIEDYSPKEIAKAIRSGIVTLYELKCNTHGHFSPLVQRQVEKLVESDEDSGVAEQATGTTETPRKSEPAYTPPTPNPEPEPYRPYEPEPVKEEIPIYTAHEPEPDFQDPVIPTYTPEQRPNNMGNLVPCPECGQMVSPNATECPMCGLPFTNSPANLSSGHAENARTSRISGATPDTGTPTDLNKFSWGGFIFGWLWGLFNGVYWSLLTWIPFVNIVVLFVLGFKGRRSAWESRKFSSVADFERTQHGWDVAGIIVFVLNIILVFFVFLIALLSEDF